MCVTQHVHATVGVIIAPVMSPGQLTMVMHATYASAWCDNYLPWVYDSLCWDGVGIVLVCMGRLFVLYLLDNGVARPYYVDYTYIYLLV